MQIVGVGAGGHAKVVIEILRLIGDWEFVGLLDRQPALWGTEVSAIRVLGGDTLLPKLYQQGVRRFFLGVGAVGNADVRRNLYDSARQMGLEPVAAIHPRAIVSSAATLGAGPTIMASAVINPAAELGDNVIVNTGAVVEHDCFVGSHAHIATGAHLAGNVRVAEGAHIGLGANVRQGILVGRNAIVGAGAVVIEDVPENVTVVGVPAKILERSNR
jgi:UDP-perosamine 4-acetyltransferase